VLDFVWNYALWLIGSGEDKGTGRRKFIGLIKKNYPNPRLMEELDFKIYNCLISHFWHSKDGE
jgi:hypothetical protein